MSLWNWKKSGWVNSTLAVFLVIAVIISVCSSGVRNGFKTISPNFSSRGVLLPETGVFHVLLICSALFGFLTVALRYSYIMDQVQVMPTSVNHLNKLSALTGISSFLGLILVSSFSASLMEMVNSIQYAGACLFIGMGIIFTILQTILTYTSSRTSITFILRLCLSVFLIATFISSIVFKEKSISESVPNKNDTIFSNDTTTITSKLSSEEKSSQTEKDMTLLAACALEWISVIIYAFFFLTFFQEFQTISAYIILRPFLSSRTSDLRSSSLTINERV